jgi:two-component sensor histidine kinase
MARIKGAEILVDVDLKAQRLHLKWTEKNGPAVRAPDKRSFGTRLVETLGKQLKGDVHLTYEPSGFVYAFEVPLASLMSIETDSLK